MSPRTTAARSLERPTEAPDARLSPTARQLLDVAERLFAERGLEAVSLREIVAASGQRNLSAAQYHFGSREALLGMLLERRVYAINLLRHARLDALETEGRAGDVRAVVTASTAVLADVVRDEAWGPDYVRVTAQVLMHPSAPAVIDGTDPVYWSGHTRAQRMLRALLPALADDDFYDRLRIVNNEIVFALARWIHAHGSVTPATRARYDALVSHTVGFLAAGMAAPAAARAAPARRRPAPAAKRAAR